MYFLAKFLSFESWILVTGKSSWLTFHFAKSFPFHKDSFFFSKAILLALYSVE